MNDEATSAEWGRDRRGLSDDPTMLPRLAEIAGIPTPPQSQWRAATVVMFAANPLGVVSAYLQHIQDFAWPVPEHALVSHTIALLQHRANGTKPQ